jgi:hypothetical protein
MGLYHAMSKLKTVLNLQVYGFPLITAFGVNANARKGDHPMMYLDMPSRHTDTELLQATDYTETSATVELYLIVGEKDPAFVALNKTMDEFLLETLPAYIDNLILTANRVGTFKSDGSRGSSVKITDIDFDYDPKDPIAAIRVILNISQFT